MKYAILILAITLAHCGILTIEDYLLLPERIYAKKRYIFSGSVNQDSPGFVGINLKFKSVSFEKPVKVHTFLVSHLGMDAIHDHHLEKKVCHLDETSNWSLAETI
jgi:hypothetical protein